MNSKVLAIAIGLTIGTAYVPLQAQEATSNPDRKEAADQAVTDAWITTKVKADLLATEDVGGTSIDVDTKSGVVTLNGTVKSQAEADKAVSTAKGIKGVTSVTSNLRVEPADDK